MNHIWRTSLLLVVFLGISGCMAMANSIANSPSNITALKTVSAGYTGCLPDENQVSNINATAAGTTWNAKCKSKSKIYLCSSVGYAGDGTESHSCARASN